MEYEIRISEAADRDIDEILIYIAEKLKNPKAAVDFVNELDKKYAELEKHPFIFEMSRNKRLAQRGYRRFVVGSYVALYLVNERERAVIIARIFYGKREYDKYI